MPAQVMEFIKDFSVTKEDGSQVKIAGEIPKETLEKHRSAAIKALGKNIKIDGFREGHIPEDVLIKKVGEINILTEMAERALAEVYPKAVIEHKIEAVGHPQIQITKIASSNQYNIPARIAPIIFSLTPQWLRDIVT